MKYFLHGKGLGLGNFINSTPFLQALSVKWNQPINVYFDEGITKDCFLDAPFLNILKDKPSNFPFAHTKLYQRQYQENRKYLIPDYEYFSKEIGAYFGVDGSQYHTYIDTIKDFREVPKTACFVNGSGAFHKSYLEKKIIDNEVYQNISILLDMDCICILGSSKCELPVDDTDLRGTPIRNQLAVLSRCEALITNEGGLAHAAGAYKIPTFIMWKDTDKIKNKNPNPNCFYSYDNHLDNFRKFYNLHLK
jgi:hypothetical protein